MLHGLIISWLTIQALGQLRAGWYALRTPGADLALLGLAAWALMQTRGGAASRKFPTHKRGQHASAQRALATDPICGLGADRLSSGPARPSVLCEASRAPETSPRPWGRVRRGRRGLGQGH